MDEDTRDEMYELLRHIQTETQVTALHVTHNTTEAQRLAHSLFVMRDGKIMMEDPS